jgi:hypothetical protein
LKGPKRPAGASEPIWGPATPLAKPRFCRLPWMRDPDSNRGHHDFQTDVASTQTHAESPVASLMCCNFAAAPVPGGGCPIMAAQDPRLLILHPRENRRSSPGVFIRRSPMSMLLQPPDPEPLDINLLTSEERKQRSESGRSVRRALLGRGDRAACWDRVAALSGAGRIGGSRPPAVSDVILRVTSETTECVGASRPLRGPRCLRFRFAGWPESTTRPRPLAAPRVVVCT